MNDKESAALRYLLDTFDVRTLGEGDENAGANILASMALTLSSLARPGSGIRIMGGRVIQAGCNVLASGSLSSTLIQDEVITPIGVCQNNLLSQLHRLLDDDREEEKRKDKGLDRRWNLASAVAGNPGENSLLHMMSGDPDLEPLTESYEDQWFQVLGSTPNPRLSDLIRRPHFFIPAASPAVLAKRLSGAHLGHTLISIGFKRSGDAEAFGNVCSDLIDGMIPAGPVGESVRGRLLVTDPGGVLTEAARMNGDKTKWLSRLFWLVDGDVGPEFTPGNVSEGTVRLVETSTRFGHAVVQILANRLNSRCSPSVIYETEIAGGQTRWMGFLRDMEHSLPGIRGSARSLFASLLFGLQRLVEAAEPPEGFKLYQNGVEAFARHLVMRMANHRASILFTAQQEWRLRHKRKIFAKLANGPLDTRSIYRPRIPADLCRELLVELMNDGCVKPSGDKWARIEGAKPPEDIRQLFLEAC